MKKGCLIIVIVIVCLIVLIGIIASNSNKSPNTASKDNIIASSSNNHFNVISQETKNDEEIKNIEIRYELQDIYKGKQKIVIWVKNNSEKIFSANLHVDVKSAEGHILAVDSFNVNNLKPGQQTYGILWADTDYSVKECTYYWSNIKFADSPIEESNGTLDEKASKELTDDIYMNFGGAGNPKYKTSWYDFIKKIEVYSDGKNKWAVITISTKDPNKSNSIGRAILYTPDYLSKVILIDEKQNKISEIYK